MTHHRRQQRKVQEARKSPDRPDGCARSQLSPNSDEPGGGAGDEPSGEAGDVPAVGRVLSRAVRRVLSRARVRETIVQCCIPKSQAAAAVKHTAHNLRTPKHEGLYRYGRRCGRCCCCSTQRARARAHRKSGFLDTHRFPQGSRPGAGAGRSACEPPSPHSQ